MIADNFPKSSHLCDQQQVAPWWLSGIGSVSMSRKKCMKIFCRKAQEQIRLKFIVEPVSWQLSVLVSVAEIKLIFYSCKHGFLSLGLRPSRPLLFSLQDLFCPRPFPFSKMVVLLSSCLNFGVFLGGGELGSFYHLGQSPS